MGNSSSSSSSLEDTEPLPQKYVVLKCLGEGGFGRVVKCLDLETKEIVAVKIAKHNENLSNEASMMKLLMDHNLDQQSIIKFYDGFSTHLVFEVLDITLLEYLHERQAPMRPQDVRAVIQQLATAFDALKNIGVIHTDVKTNNIMLVDRVRQPFKVKLIDFGLAIFKSDAKNHGIHQNPFFRAPEVMLGLPFSEAVDIWSLGCVMTLMVFGFTLFPGRTDYDILRYIIDILGPPPDHIIDAGQRSRLYFKKTDSNQWMFKTPKEYWGSTHYFIDNRRYTFRSLDEVKTMCLKKNNMAEADERRECIELLKAMLKWDERERITPSEILAHPFITMSYLSSSSYLSSRNEALESAAAKSSPSQEPETSKNQAAEPGTDQAPETGINQAAEPGTKQTPETNINQAAEPGTKQTPETSINQAAEPGTKQTPETSINQAAEPGTEQTPKTSINQAAEPGTKQTPETSINQAAEPGTDQAPETSINQAAEPGTEQTPETSINQAAEPGTDQAPETSIDQSPETSTSQTAEPSTSTHGTQAPTSGFFRIQSAAAVMASGLIMVQPAPPQNRIPLEEESDEESVSESDTLSSIPEDSDCTPAAAPATALEDTNNPADDTEDGEPKRKKKKRKNCIRRFFSWWKRTVCSCCNVDDVAE